MILRSVELENFGRFRNQTIEFRRGMNIVIGPNEAGKSTLAETVPAVLFGTNQLEKYKPWGRNACDAALFFEGSGRTIQIKRNLVTDEVELVEKDDMYHVLSQFSGKAPLRGRSASCREYRDLVARLLGVGDDKLFRATYYFGHHPQEWSGDELAQNLRTLVSGTAEADYAEILDELLEEHFSLTCSNPWGRDKKQARDYELVCQQVEELGLKETVPVFVEIDAPDDLSSQVEALSAELVNDRIEHEKGLKYIERVRRQVESSNESPKAVAIDTAEPLTPPVTKKTETSYGDIPARLKEVGLPPNPPSELPELLADATQIRQEMAELQQPYSVLNSREKKIPVVPWGLLTAVLALSLIASGVAWWFEYYFTGVASAAGVVVAATLIYGGWRHAGRQKAQAECRKQRGRLDQKKVAAQARQSELSERCEAFGLPSSPIDLVRLQKLVTKHEDLLNTYWQDQGSALTETEVVVTDEVADTDNVSDTTEGPKIENFVELAEDNEELREMEERLAEFEAAMKEKQSRLESLKAQLAGTHEELQAKASADGQPLIRRKLELEEKITILRKAVDLLAGSVEEFGQSHLVKLNEEAGRVFGKITSGRYTELRLDENMLPSVKIDNRRWLPVDRFSRGTVDAIYLALRVALAKVRDDGRSLPLMLDDPFVHLDQKRLTKALNTVDLASADGQLILFSHNMELGKRAAKERWHVVPLGSDQIDMNIEEEEGVDNVGQLHLL